MIIFSQNNALHAAALNANSGLDRFDCQLWDFLKDQNKYSITLAERVELLIEIIEVIIFIQMAGYSHRDIKPSNGGFSNK